MTPDPTLSEPSLPPEAPGAVPRPAPSRGTRILFGALAAIGLPGFVLVGAPPAAGAPVLPAQEQVATATAAAPATVDAADSIPAVRRLVGPEDYARFESLGAVSFSPDGGWVTAAISRFDEDGEVRILPSDVGAPGGRVVPKAVRAEVAEGGRWAAVVLQPGLEERRRLERNRTPIRNDLLLIDLQAGEEADRKIEEIQTFSFSPDGQWILLRRYAPANGNRGYRGVDVLVMELAGGAVTNFGNVAEAQWAEEGALLAMIVDADGQAGNGVRLFEPSTGRIRTLVSEGARFQGLNWRDESRDLALFRVDPDSARGDTTFAVLAWRGADRDGAVPAVLSGDFVPMGGEGRWRVSDFRGLRWAEDGSRIFVGIQTREGVEDEPGAEEPGEPGEGEERPREGGQPPRPTAPGGGGGGGGGADSVPGLEIWHARDVDPIPQQRLRANQDRRRSALSAWTLGGAPPVYLGGDGPGESVTILPGEGRAVILDDDRWGEERMFGPIFRDVAVVDVATGVRTPVRERVEFYQGASPTGRYLLFWADDHFHLHDLDRGETRVLTEGVDAVFTNQEVDVVVQQKPSYGVGGWTEGDEHLLVYDRLDIWRIRVDGRGAERLTRGAEDGVRHRLVRLDPDQDAWPRSGPWVVSLFGDRTKESGWGELRPGRGVEVMAFEERGLSRLSRSDDGRRALWVSQRYDDPPTLHVADARLGGKRDLLQVNPFVRDAYLWGRAQLLDFDNGWGVPLQAILHYPADFEPGRQYPMVVYHYERLSQGLHNWVNPSDRSAYNITALVQNGYFVLQPDIVYRPRDPGRSAMAAFDPALDAALATGHVDPARIGIMGHSWGGYQTTFAVTQTDRFAAAVAGAPLTNLISMYLSFYWNSGGTDARIFEISQGRMEVPWWEDYEAYVANSPVHHIQNMNTPLLMAFGTEDGAVEFNQGVEFYNAARRAGKDFVLLVYDGENHSLARRPNQVDYHRRTLEWFNHHLKGEEAAPWITEGVRYLDQQEKLRQGPAAGRIPVPQAPQVNGGAAGGG
jgi:dipeptidyl aminopeptidase/acylaminoacyl peptidase